MSIFEEYGAFNKIYVLGTCQNWMSVVNLMSITMIFESASDS